MRCRLCWLGVVGFTLAAGMMASPSGVSAPEVLVHVARQDSLTRSVVASCELAFASEVPLRPEITAKVRRVLVRAGDRVGAGTDLIELESDLPLAQQREAEAKLAIARTDLRIQELQAAQAQRMFDRLRQLRASGVANQRDYEDAELAVNVARASLERIRHDIALVEAQLAQIIDRLGKSRIRSPIAGIVTSVHVQEGETAVATAATIPGSLLVTVADTSRNVAEILVHEADIGTILPGLEVGIRPAVAPDRLLPGRVTEVAAVATRNAAAPGRYFVIRADVALPDGEALRSGMSCRAEITVGSEAHGFPVPLEAVQANRGADGRTGYSVLLSRSGTVVRRPVEVGLRSDTHAAIMSGISAGDAVIVGPARVLATLRPGGTVTARAAE